jgi:ABC-type branched-chain amino acid transport systems, ATPase component
LNNVLEMRGVSKSFGGLAALSDVNLTVPEGSIVSIIGPNGAGKTTFFNVVTGFYPIDRGEILLNGKSIKGLSPAHISRKGIARTFQNIRLFKGMNAIENVMVGMENRLSAGLFGILTRTRKVRLEEERVRLEAYRLLKFVGIEEYAEYMSQHLSYGIQRRLEIARALASRPSILMLDEPAAGMNPQETEKLTDLIMRLRDELNVTIMLIEHDLKLVMKLSERIHVLDYGKKIAEGTPEEIRNDPRVIEAYLGKSEEESEQEHAAVREVETC